MKIFYLYKITNEINGKVYVGGTFRPTRRWIEHKSQTSPCTKLKRAMIKHGKQNFTFEILCIGEENYIFELERLLIDSYNSVSCGYNIQSGGHECTFSPKYRSTDTPIFVSGFWFQSDRQAYKTLGIPKRTYFDRKRKGLVGELISSYAPIKPRIQIQPRYVCGFWFPSTKIAAESLNISERTVIVKHNEFSNNL